MEKFKHLRESLEGELRNAADIPFRYRKMSATVQPPFGVYLLDLVLTDDFVEQYGLTLDLADYDSNSDRLDDLADHITLHLDHLAVLDGDQWWKCHLESRHPVEEGDKNIQRIRMNFEIRYAFRGVDSA